MSKPFSNEDEVTSLLEVLLETGRRIEELTAGQVDTAADPEGRMLLLRGTRKQIKFNEVAKQAAILNALPAYVALLGPDGVILSVNDGWKMYATSENSPCGLGRAVGLNYLDICESEIGARSNEAIQAAKGIRSVLDGSVRNFSLDFDCSTPNEEIWLRLSVTPLSVDRPNGVVVMHEDVTVSKQHQSALMMLTERLSLATEVAKVGVWDWDLASNALTWDATMFTIYGIPPMALMPFEQWRSAIHPEDRHAVEVWGQRATDGWASEPLEFRVNAGDGTLKHVFAAQRAVVDSSGAIHRLIGVNVDITERKKADEDSRINQAIATHLAEHDFLTDLPNQRVLRDRIDQAIKQAARNQKKVAVLFLDLDGFKHINDSLGHAIGDKLLISISKRLVQSTRASDTVCRFGGDEFIVLLPDSVYPEGTGATAVRMLEALAAIHCIDDLELQVTASVGISVYPDDGQDVDTLIKNADAAMYHAKGKGGSSHEFFHADMNLRAIERQFIEQHLRRALERQELALHYQPKYDLKTQTITGVEALLRWTHPVRGAIPPAAFIPIAEDCGLILPIGTWVLVEACRQARAWLDDGLPAINIAVNVSERQFQSEGFGEKVVAILDRFRINPGYLELEVTESLLIKSPELTVLMLQGLRQKGVRIALDDFGTGYSSLSYLRRFPIDTLKIDQSFIRQIDTPGGRSIVKSIIHLGRELGMRIVAEGVETEEEAHTLEGMHCDRAQGYYFSRPLPPASLASLLELSPRSGATGVIDGHK